jgi:hypothetical protein
MKSIELARFSASRHRGNTATAAPRLPMQALTDLLRGVDPQFNYRRLGDVLDTSRGEIHRFLREGVPERRADEFACRLGMHPGEVWGDDWWALAASCGDDAA